MNKSITAVLALLVTAGGARAGSRADQSGLEPQLQFSRLSGKIEIETPGRKEIVSGQKLPYLRSGSIVRVLSGAAEFQSDLRATVRAGKGDAFHFMTIKPESGRRGSMSITAVETEPKALEVAVGGEKFQLKKGARLTISAADPGEVNVQSERGDVKIAAGGVGKNGATRSSARMMASGDALIVPVGEGRFEGPSMSLSDVSVVRKNDTTFIAEGEGRPASKLASADEARGAVSRWPTASRLAAEAMLEKYGVPSAADDDKLSWSDNGGWKRTTVYRLPREGGDVLEQTISYAVPRDKRADLAKLDFMVTVNQADRELSATSESEQTNYLALNLADDVVHDRRTPEDASDFYMATVKLSQSGRNSPYMQGLMFQP